MTNKVKIDKAELENLFRTYFSSLITLANKYIPEFNIAKDIVRNVYYMLWEQKEELYDHKSIKAFLYRSVQNQCYLYIKENPQYQTSLDLNTIQSGNYSDLADNNINDELKDQIKLIVDNLPELDKSIFKMKCCEGMRYSEIAEKRQIPLITVQKTMAETLKLIYNNIH